jgi:hypothetical protein
VGNGYIPNNNAAPVMFTLPMVPYFPGDTIEILGFGTAGWTIALSGGQQIHLLGKTATSSVSSTTRYDSLIIICADASGPQFVVASSQGNLTIT